MGSHPRQDERFKKALVVRSLEVGLIPLGIAAVQEKQLCRLTSAAVGALIHALGFGHGQSSSTGVGSDCSATMHGTHGAVQWHSGKLIASPCRALLCVVR